MRYIDRFGLAVVGQVSYNDLRRMVIAENVARAYHDRARAESWAEWAHEHPDQAELLAEAARWQMK